MLYTLKFNNGSWVEWILFMLEQGLCWRSQGCGRAGWGLSCIEFGAEPPTRRDCQHEKAAECYGNAFLLIWKVGYAPWIPTSRSTEIIGQPSYQTSPQKLIIHTHWKVHSLLLPCMSIIFTSKTLSRPRYLYISSYIELKKKNSILDQDL